MTKKEVMPKRIFIDSEKLNTIFKNRGLIKGDVSTEMGHGRNYISDITRRGTMPRHAVLFLQRSYNIDPSDYQIIELETNKDKETSVNDKKPEISINDLTDKQLYRLIYAAVYHGTKKALEEAL